MIEKRAGQAKPQLRTSMQALQNSKLKKSEDKHHNGGPQAQKAVDSRGDERRRQRLADEGGVDVALAWGHAMAETYVKEQDGQCTQKATESSKFKTACSHFGGVWMPGEYLKELEADVNLGKCKLCYAYDPRYIAYLGVHVTLNQLSRRQGVTYCKWCETEGRKKKRTRGPCYGKGPCRLPDKTRTRSRHRLHTKTKAGRRAQTDGKDTPRMKTPRWCWAQTPRLRRKEKG